MMAGAIRSILVGSGAGLATFYGTVALGGGDVKEADPRRMRVYGQAVDSAVTLLQQLDPERAHGLTIRLCAAGLTPDARSSLDPRLETTVWGRSFASPVGLAAGFDKQGEAVRPILRMGFGFLEVGGVTPEPQPGNPKPRMFRLTEDQAVINRFGLNSDGAMVVAERLQQTREGLEGLVGVNLAKNTASDDATKDYVEGVRRLGPHVDFIVLNVSCPNVAWTSSLSSDKSGLLRLVLAVKEARDGLAARKPLLLKLGPDMDPAAQQGMAKLALETGVDGLIVSNTTNARPDTLQSPHAKERGGLSGKPLYAGALASLKDMYSLTGGKIPIIGVGGISSGEQAYERIRAGASLVQLYTALAYQGPGLIPRINEELAQYLERDGFSCLADAVGVDVPLTATPSSGSQDSAPRKKGWFGFMS